MLRGLLATVALLAITGKECRGEVPVLTVCEVLANRMMYNGESIIVVGRYFAYMEGASVDGDCESNITTDGRSWSNSLWLGNTPPDRRPPPSANVPLYSEYEEKILQKSPSPRLADWKVVQDCEYMPGVWAAIYGRFETKISFPLIWREPNGFGHLGGYVAQLVFPASGFWCLVPAEKYREYLALENSRQAESQRSLWRHIRDALQSSDGHDFFVTYMKDRPIPAMRGTIISIDSATSVKTLILAMSDGTTPELRIRVESLLDRVAVPGAEVEFRGVAKAFALKPFQLTLDVAADSLRVLDHKPVGPRR